MLLLLLQGCPSWKWFYPFHYAPFASDFRNIKKVRNDFDKGTAPFRPLEQLMGVFPESSGKFLPPSWHHLMGDEVGVVRMMGWVWSSRWGGCGQNDGVMRWVWSSREWNFCCCCCFANNFKSLPTLIFCFS